MTGMPRIIDISIPISPTMPTWPGDPAVRLIPHGSPATEGFHVSELTLGTHTGTHVDPPAHFFPGAATVDQLALEALIGPAVVADVCAGDGPVEAADLAPVDLEGTTRLLLRTSSTPWPEHPEHWRGLSAGASELLVAKGVELVGIDSLSIDEPSSGTFPAHRILLAAGTVIVEGLDLSNVQAGPAELCCLPLAITGADGAPARAVLIQG